MIKPGGAMWSRLMVAGCGVAAALSLAACGGEAVPTTLPDGCRPFEIVVSTSILGDVVANVAGEGGQVEVLMPVGVDPHSFQPSAAQAAALRRADVAVVNGLGLEEGLQEVVAAAAADGVAVVEAASFVDPLPFALGAAGDPGEGAEAPATLDPHIWMDPRRMADVAAGLGEALAAADPACAAGWRQRAAAYREVLLDLDAEVAAALEPIPAGRRKLVTNHHAFGYFADRYGFEVVGSIIPGGSTLAEPSPADLAALVEVLRREEVRAIFTETIGSPDLAEALAAELGEGVAVVSLYTGSLGEPGSGAETYLGMMRVDATRLAAALTP